MGINRKERLKPAVFLDRDGTLVKHVDLLHKVSQLKLLPRAASAVREFNRLGYLAIIITNQPVIARGMIEPKEVDVIHAVLVKLLERGSAKVDAVYFCPHHPEASLKKYRLRCSCRKPEPGMILKAIKKYKIDRKRSFMIGDAMIDVVAGRRAGLKTILVKTGPGHRLDKQFNNIKPDFVVKNLSEAVKTIKKYS